MSEEYQDIFAPWFGNEMCDRIITNLELMEGDDEV